MPYANIGGSQYTVSTGVVTSRPCPYHPDQDYETCDKGGCDEGYER